VLDPRSASTQHVDRRAEQANRVVADGEQSGGAPGDADRPRGPEPLRQPDLLVDQGGHTVTLPEALGLADQCCVGGPTGGLTVTAHLCRGNFRSSWVAEGGYDFVADALFGRLDVDGFFLECHDARSGGFEPLRFVPPGKRVVLGLVTTKRPQSEDRDELKRRIEVASRFVPIEQLALSPHAGSPRRGRATR
jgi:hypothetical protein